MRLVIFLVPAVFLAAPVAVFAQVDRPQPAPIAVADAKGKADSKDPNRMVCRTNETTGSRLGKTRECRTAAEWAEIAAIQRRDIERTQANRYKGNN